MGQTSGFRDVLQGQPTKMLVTGWGGGGVGQKLGKSENSVQEQTVG